MEAQQEQDGEQPEGQVDHCLRHAAPKVCAADANHDGPARDAEGGEAHRARAEGPTGAGRFEAAGGVQVDGRSPGIVKGGR
eukprot:661218-Pyramimonas_sp.AAC.1